MKRRWMGRWLVGSLVGLVAAGAVQRAEAYTIDLVQSVLTTRTTARVGNDFDADADSDHDVASSSATAIGDTAVERFATSLSNSLNLMIVVDEVGRRIRTSTQLSVRDGPGRPDPDEKATAGATGLIAFTTHKSRPGELDDILLVLTTAALHDTYSYMVTDVISGEVLFNSASSGFGGVVFLPTKVGHRIRVDYSGYIEISGGSISQSLTSSVEVRSIPEPGTGILACLGLATLGWRRRFEHWE